MLIAVWSVTGGVLSSVFVVLVCFLFVFVIWRFLVCRFLWVGVFNGF